MIRRPPTPPSVFIGREEELQRLVRGLQRVPLAVISGVGGVGKTALALTAAAEWPGPVLFKNVSHQGETTPVLLDALRREALQEPTGPAQSDDDRAVDLARRLDAQGTLCIVDDLHRLEGEEPRSFLERLAPLLTRGRLLVTTRHQVALGARGPDSAQLQLEGLDEASARQLWTALDDLQGRGPAFSPTFSRTRGLPLLLRKAHQRGVADDEDPILETVAALTPSSFRLAALLSLTDVPLPRAVFAGEGSALEELASRLVITFDHEGATHLHDLFRESILRRLSPDHARALQRWLAETLPQLEGLHPVSRLRERVRLLLALEDAPAAREVLLGEAEVFIRHGATAELLASLDLLPRDQRTPEISLLRARTRARLLDLFGAYEEVRGWLASGEFPPAEVRLVFGMFAMLRGELEQAEFILRFLLQDPSVTEKLRMRVLTHLSITLTHRGQGDEARTLLEHALAQTETPLHRGYVHLAIAYSYWMEERPESEASLRRALALLHEAPGGYRSRVLAASAELGILAFNGRIKEAEAALVRAQAALARGQDLRTRMLVQHSHAQLLFAKGAHAEAAALLETTIAAEERGGATLDAIFGKPLLARALRKLGRDAQAQQVERAALEQAKACGIVSVVRRLEAVAPPTPEVIVDAREHTLALDGVTHSLVRRPVLRRLLYALSAAPGEVVTKEQLAQAIWAREYDPRLHDNALRLNVKQLRALTDGSALTLEFDDVGYRMKVPSGFRFVPAAPK